MGVQRVSLAFDGRGRAGYPAAIQAPSIQVAPSVIAPGIAILQPLGASSSVVPVAVPILVAGVPQDVSFTVPLTGWPSPFALAVTATALATGFVFLSASPTDATTMVGLPVVSLTFGAGNPQNAGTSLWSLRGGVTYQVPSLAVTVRVVSFAGAAAQSLTFTGQGVLYGIPAG